MEQPFKKKKVGVLMGGLSREREISLKTGKAILKALTEKGYHVHAIDVGHDIAEILLKEKIECAFLALHGRFGEDGTIQGMLELMRIPYTGSGVLASSLAMHKVMSKKIFLYEKIPTPSHDVFVRAEIEKDPLRKISLPLPVIIKPAREGSTLGISIVRTEEQLLPALREAAKYDEEILIEEFIQGKEITVGILGDIPLPIIEIVPKSGFYDYHSKYTKGETQYIIPARIPREKYLYAQEIALKAFGVLGCSGCARVDLMTDEEGNPFVIDVNTMPGMTETSLLPQAASYAGINFEELAERILLGASLKIEGGKTKAERRSGGNHNPSSVPSRTEEEGSKESQGSFKWKAAPERGTSSGESRMRSTSEERCKSETGKRKSFKKPPSTLDLGPSRKVWANH